MRLLHTLLFLAPILTACSSDGPTRPDPKGDTGAVSGTVGGAAWGNTAFAQATWAEANKTYILSASDVSLGGRAVMMVLTDVDKPGTYSLGLGVPFRYANVALQAGVWETTQTSTGQAVLTIVTPQRLKGTLTFTGVPAASYPNATGTVAVNLAFDVTVVPVNTGQ